VKNALIIGAEVLSKVIDWSDRATCVLMGDGAGAAVLRKSDAKGIANIFCGSKGENGDILRIPGIPVNNPFSDGGDSSKSYIHMNGKEVFQFASGIIVSSINRLLEQENLCIDDIKYIVPHQANYRIIDYGAKRLGISADKFYMNLDRYGNTSAASIPIALDEMNRQGLLGKGDRIILVAFGGGLTYGGALIQWT
jgi:3-oxoacyl-[acyl-carrier-protein] synthase-3